MTQSSRPFRLTSRHWVKFASRTRCKVKEGQIREGNVVVMQSTLSRVSTRYLGIEILSWGKYGFAVSDVSNEEICILVQQRCTGQSQPYWRASKQNSFGRLDMNLIMISHHIGVLALGQALRTITFHAGSRETTQVQQGALLATGASKRKARDLSKPRSFVLGDPCSPWWLLSHP